MTTLTTSQNHSALLILDYQIDIIKRNIKQAKAEKLLDKTASLLLWARSCQIPIIYVMVGFRPNYPEVSTNNRIFSKIEKQGLFLLDLQNTGIHPKVAPTRDDPVIIKHRYGSFSATDLDMILHAQNIDTLVMAGISTSGVVLTTVRQAFDLDYRLIVAKDCCADANEDIHITLVNQILPLQAEVVMASDIIQSWSR